METTWKYSQFGISMIIVHSTCFLPNKIKLNEKEITFMFVLTVFHFHLCIVLNKKENI